MAVMKFGRLVNMQTDSLCLLRMAIFLAPKSSGYNDVDGAAKKHSH